MADFGLKAGWVNVPLGKSFGQFHRLYLPVKLGLQVFSKNPPGLPGSLLS